MPLIFVLSGGRVESLFYKRLLIHGVRLICHTKMDVLSEKDMCRFIRAIAREKRLLHLDWLSEPWAGA